MTDNAKGEKIGKCMPPIEAGKDTRFKPWVKPPATPEQKKAGRDRKKQWQAMMDMILKYQNMTFQQIKELAEDENAMAQLSVLEVTMIKYIQAWFKDNKMLIDMVNRHVWYAPTKIELEAVKEVDPARQVLDSWDEDEIQDTE